MIRAVPAICAAIVAFALGLHSFTLLAADTPEGALEANVISTASSVLVTEVYPNSPGNDLGDDGNVPEFIKLENQGSQSVSLSHLKLVRQDNAEAMWLTDDPEAALASGEYLYFQPTFGLVNGGMTVQLYFVDTNGKDEILLQHITYPAEAAKTETLSLQLFGNEWYSHTPSSPAEVLPGFPQRAVTSEAPREDDPDDEEEADPDKPENEESQPPSTPPEPPRCGVTNKDVRISEILSNPPGYDSGGGEFVELYNASAKKVSLAGCTLSTDKLDAYVFTANDSITPKGFKRISLSDELLNGGGTVTFSGKNYEFKISYPELTENTAYANINGTWQITAKPTPGAPNRLPTAAERLAALNDRLGTCPPGQFRNLETSRCNTKKATSGLTPCAPNQFRNPETNRCKLKTSAASSLKPCNSDQFRNPETNRCKKKDSENKLKPCDEDQYRSEETNRCRKKETVGGGVLGADNGNSDQNSGVQNLAVVLIAGGCLLLFLAYEYRLAIRGWIAKLKPPKAAA